MKNDKFDKLVVAVCPINEFAITTLHVLKAKTDNFSPMSVSHG